MIKTFNIPKYYSVEINTETGSVNVISNSKHAKGRKLSQYINSNGYLSVKINNRTIQIHYLVSLFLLGEREKGLCVNHKDGNKLNNKIENLEYVTIAENIKHAVRTGLHVCTDPKRSGRYKDGRSLDQPKYKKAWYQKNREKVLKRVRENYFRKKLLK